MDTLIGIVQGESVRPEDVEPDCSSDSRPVEWQQGIASALRKRQTHGRVRREVEPAETAGILMAMVEGYVSLANNAQDAKVSKTGKKNRVGWLRSRRVPGNRKQGSSHRF
jgi:hypothetical protein